MFASCYGQGNPLDEVCRTSGGANFQFFELADGDDYNSGISLADPTALDRAGHHGSRCPPARTGQLPAPGARTAPFLDSLAGQNGHRRSTFGANQGRVVTVDSSTTGNPDEDASLQIDQPDNTPDPTFVQPPYGAGPKFLSGVAGDR